MKALCLSLAALVFMSAEAVGQGPIFGDAPIGPPAVRSVPLEGSDVAPFVEPAGGSRGASGSVTYATPEPSSMALAIAGVAGFVGWLLLRRRRRS